MSRIYFHQTPEFSDNLNDNIIASIKTDSIADVKSFLKTTKDNFLPWNYEQDHPDVLLIPAILDATNSVSYDGVEFALQWYFYKIQNNKEFAIILLGIESRAAFFEHCDYSLLIKCPNIHYVEFSMHEIKRSIAVIQPKSFEKEQYIRSLKSIGIKPPTSYKSHHSITNEWSIYRWSKYLGIDSPLQKNLSEEIKASLYYNYLQTIYPIDDSDIQKYEILEKGNILLIDDEVEKGWSDFFKELITPNQKFRAIGENFKKLTVEEIIEKSIIEVETFYPDAVILDLRLHDDDFDKKPPEGLTGIKILEKIKSINQGIQVLAFTASNKIWNYQKLQQIGIDGFILKESPELSQDKHFTENAVETLKGNIEDALERKYLKEIFKKLSPLIKHVKFLSELSAKSYSKKGYSLPQGRINENLVLLESCESLLLLKQPELKFAFLQLILIIEDVVKTFYVDDEEENHFIEKSMFEKIYVLKKEYSKVLLRLEPENRWIKFIDRGDVLFEINDDDNDYKHLNTKSDRTLFNYRLHSVLLFKYDILLGDSVKYSQLYSKRSKLSHPNNSINISKDDLIVAIELLSVFFDTNTNY